MAPPRSGMATKSPFSRRSPGADEMTIRVQQEDFDLGAELLALREGNPKIGAIASFLGLVRDINEGDAVAGMSLEHYPGMTEKALERIVEQAKTRWNIFDALVIHRVGDLKPTDQIVHGGRDRRAPRRGFCRLRIHHGLSQDRGAVLEARADAIRRPLGGCARKRRAGKRALALIQGLSQAAF